MRPTTSKDCSRGMRLTAAFSHSDSGKDRLKIAMDCRILGPRAVILGFRAVPDFDAIVKAHINDERGGMFVA